MYFAAGMESILVENIRHTNFSARYVKLNPNTLMKLTDFILPFHNHLSLPAFYVVLHLADEALDK